MVLTTKRLRLRPFEEKDFEAVHSYASVYDNVQYMYWGPNSEQDTKNFIQEAMKKSNEAPQTNYDFAVTLKDSGIVIGGCSIYTNPELREGSLGWVLHRDYWKKGYGTEFAKELLRFGFEDLRLHRIKAVCYSENYGSYRVMERNGLRLEGRFKKCRPGRPCDPHPWYDERHYAILAEEWHSRK